MNTIYRRIAGDRATVTTGRAIAPLFGRWCVFTVTTYCFGSETAITFSFRPAEAAEEPNGTEVLPEGSRAGSSCLGAALPGGMLRFGDGAGASRRTVTQAVVMHPLYGWALELSDLREGGVEAGRTVAAGLLRKFEGVFESARRSVRKNLSREFLSVCAAALQERYGPISRCTMEGLLGQFHWRLLLDAAECGEQCLSVIEYTLGHNPPAYHDIDFDGEPQIAPLASEAPRFEVAEMRAMALLLRVCGEALAEQYKRERRIVVKSGDYEFEISGGQFVRCVDPTGRKALLCVHTVGLSCHPVDEVILAYLNIKHRLAEYMQTAIVHGKDPDFGKAVPFEAGSYPPRR